MNLLGHVVSHINDTLNLYPLCNLKQTSSLRICVFASWPIDSTCLFRTRKVCVIFTSWKFVWLVEDVLMWRDVRVSGGIFGGLTAAYLVLDWSGYSLFCLAAYALLTLLSALLIWHYAAPFVKMNPPIPSFVNNGITEEEAKKAMEKAVPIVNKTLAMLNNVITGKDLVLSVKVLGAVYIVARVSAMISLFTLAYLGTLKYS